MRRFRRTRFPRKKRRLQWLNGASPDCGSEIPLIPCGAEEPGPLANVQLFTLVDNPALAAPGDAVGSANEATVIRIVGELNLALSYVSSPSPSTVTWYTTVMVAMGIYVGDVDESFAAIVKDPLSQRDMNSKDWLWRGTYFDSECSLPGITTFSCTENDPYTSGTNANGSHLDIKVKRKLRPEESLILAVNGQFDDILTAGQVALNLRLYGNVRVLMSY